jgi:two-component system nitrate/nitrite response regulator NarL
MTLVKERLNPRELEILKILSHGQTLTSIARELHISKNTVKTHLKNLYRKIDVHNRKEACVKASEAGLL